MGLNSIKLDLAIKQPINIDLQTIKEHLTIEHNEDDALLQGYLDSAKAFVEKYLLFPISEEEWEYRSTTPKPAGTYDAFIEFEPALVEVDGNPIDFIYEEPNILFEIDHDWADLKVVCPSLDSKSQNIAYQAIKLFVASAYANREDTMYAQRNHPQSVEKLLNIIKDMVV